MQLFWELVKVFLGWHLLCGISEANTRGLCLRSTPGPSPLCNQSVMGEFRCGRALGGGGDMFRGGQMLFSDGIHWRPLNHRFKMSAPAVPGAPPYPEFTPSSFIRDQSQPQKWIWCPPPPTLPVRIPPIILIRYFKKAPRAQTECAAGDSSSRLSSARLKRSRRKPGRYGPRTRL